jgi:uncharacterized protein (DUF1697 family)
MEALRGHFEAMRFGRVESFIASGNILFDAKSADVEAIESRIEKKLSAELGYSVDTFVRSAEQLAEIVAHRPFGDDDPVLDDHAVHVLFFRSAFARESQKRIAALGTSYDDFHVAGREVFWRTRGRFSDSKLTPPTLLRAFAAPSTARSVTTVRKLAALIVQER